MNYRISYSKILMARAKNSLYTEQNAGYFDLIEGRQGVLVSAV